METPLHRFQERNKSEREKRENQEKNGQGIWIDITQKKGKKKRKRNTIPRRHVNKFFMSLIIQDMQIR